MQDSLIPEKWRRSDPFPVDITSDLSTEQVAPSEMKYSDKVLFFMLLPDMAGGMSPHHAMWVLKPVKFSTFALGCVQGPENRGDELSPPSP